MKEKTMKHLWVKVDPYKKKLVTTALESGADAVWVPAGRAAEVKSLGLIQVVAPDGDLVPGQDVQEVTVTGTDQEPEVVRLAKSGPVVVRTPDWTVIPLENLVAQCDNLFVEVSDPDSARTFLGVLEKGVDGLVVVTDDPSVIKAIARLVKEASPKVDLEVARITQLKPLGMGDRVCVDTCSNWAWGKGCWWATPRGPCFWCTPNPWRTPMWPPAPSG
jgi:3-dehydroquinate synthase II